MEQPRAQVVGVPVESVMRRAVDARASGATYQRLLLAAEGNSHLSTSCMWQGRHFSAIPPTHCVHLPEFASPLVTPLCQQKTLGHPALVDNLQQTVGSAASSVVMASAETPQTHLRAQAGHPRIATPRISPAVTREFQYERGVREEETGQTDPHGAR